MTKHRSNGGKRARRASRPSRIARRGIPWIVWPALVGMILVVVGIVLVADPLGKASAVRPEVTGQPKLAVDREKIDFGRLPLNKPVKATFKLSNVGDQPLRIQGQPAIQVLKGC